VVEVVVVEVVVEVKKLWAGGGETAVANRCE